MSHHISSSSLVLTGGQKGRSQSELTDRKTLPYPWALQPPGLWGGMWKRHCRSGYNPHQSEHSAMCGGHTYGWEGPGHTAPDHTPATLLGSLRRVPCILCLGQCVDTDRLGASQVPEPEPLQLTLPMGQKIEKPGPLLSPVPKPDHTHIYTCAHTHIKCSAQG